MKVKKTILHDVHTKLGAKMVEFAGYFMPMQYRGVKEEHHAVRNSVGIFDVSHMGEFFIRGEKATEFLQKISINDVTRLQKYQAQYTAFCYDNGGIVDDLIVYNCGNQYLTVINAANREKDYQWMEQHLIDGVEIKDKSDDVCLFAVQGCNAHATLQKLTDLDLSGIRFFCFGQGELAGEKAFVARTGYTGEDGFEVGVYCDAAENVWNAILAAGKEFNIEPVGLAARDTLRIEMKYCLYGNDIDETTNPIEAGLGWITKVDKDDFIGRDAIFTIKEAGAKRMLVGFELKDRAVPRQGYKIIKDENEIGIVTSGIFSPSLEKGIGIAYIDAPFHQTGTEIELLIRDKSVVAEVVKTPFYQRPY